MRSVKFFSGSMSAGCARVCVCVIVLLFPLKEALNTSCCDNIVLMRNIATMLHGSLKN